ncbi:DUF3152 domain-containing protein, partial [Streptomyces sp. CC77]|uniref:DUF3152 domain-containing protein n=2 Tax=unclassified Streptomyces TaxID=2593676 RepID=UPI0008DE6290
GRGGHPEHREAGGGWGGGPYAAAPDPAAQPPRAAARIAQGPPRIPGPRREFVEAFDEPAEGGAGGHRPGDDAEGGEGAPQRRSGFGRAFAGVVAAAVTTVLAVVVAGQVADGQRTARGARAADASARPGGDDPVSRSDERPTPSQGSASPSPTASAPAPPTYAVLMTRQFDVDPGLKGSGDFEAVPGADPAPGKGRKVRYRVDVEKGLDLDAALFARAVQETLNDDRSWAHGGAMTFERISSGDPDFVITLASPGTTGVWCAKSGLDTTVDNVSCDSAATQRIMINAYRWARGADTYGPDRMLAYRQMLINHEVGHRLGHNHENCRKPGGLAPVMQQQTKTLEIGGISCRPNPWVYPSA